MRTIPVEGGVPVKSWAREVDRETMKQALNLARLPCAFHHVALMPDCHVGFGMPIGGVLAAENAVVPNAVGVDIGCGMTAARTDLEKIDRDDLVRLLEDIKDLVPTGFRHHSRPQPWEGFDRAPEIPVVMRELESSRRQLGTLGGGNHFIEIQREEAGPVWVMVHSGSRNFGLKIATEYHRKAVRFCDRHKVRLPDRDLAYFPFDSEEGQEYYRAMLFAQEFAAANRARILETIRQVLAARLGGRFVETLDVHHNYAAVETHFGRRVVVHRKGATAAFEGRKGIIPGSQGSASYIVEGKGNLESFRSSSHGAGRRLSRREANRVLTEEVCEAAMRGIVHEAWRGRFDEAPQAYKDIDQVMADQDDLVRPLHRLRPIGVIKGEAELQV